MVTDIVSPLELVLINFFFFFLLLPEDDWGDIEGPSSPPKACSGAMNLATSIEEHTKGQEKTGDRKMDSSSVTANSKVEAEAQDEVNSPPESLAFVSAETASSSGIDSPYDELPPAAQVSVSAPDASDAAATMPTAPAKVLDVKTKERGDMVMVGSEVSSDRTTPLSDHSSNEIPSTNKGMIPLL